MTIAHVELPSSPLAPRVSPVRIRYRESGRGAPLVILHGGWGTALYPFDDAIDGLESRYRIVMPERSGYGRSTPIDDLRADFHQRAADETLRVLDALGIERAAIWGESDGAVIAVRIALAAPDRIAGVVLEAMHLWGAKPASRWFFERAAERPESFGETVASALEREHGVRWPGVVARHGRAWLRISEQANDKGDDLYAGRLHELDVPTLIVHGGRDPRTEPGELDAVRAALPHARVLVLPDAGHSPHSEPATAHVVTRAVGDFLDAVAGAREPDSTPADAATKARASWRRDFGEGQPQCDD